MNDDVCCVSRLWKHVPSVNKLKETPGLLSIKLLAINLNKIKISPKLNLPPVPMIRKRLHHANRHSLPTKKSSLSEGGNLAELNMAVSVFF